LGVHPHNPTGHSSGDRHEGATEFHQGVDGHDAGLIDQLHVFWADLLFGPVFSLHLQFV